MHGVDAGKLVRHWAADGPGYYAHRADGYDTSADMIAGAANAYVLAGGDRARATALPRVSLGLYGLVWFSPRRQDVLLRCGDPALGVVRGASATHYVVNDTAAGAAGRRTSAPVQGKALLPNCRASIAVRATWRNHTPHAC